MKKQEVLKLVNDVLDNYPNDIDKQPHHIDNPNKSPWIQGYIDALNDTINLQAANESQDYRDGYETAAAAEVKYIEQYMRGEDDGF